MSAFGILSYGAYIPRRRISRAAIAEAVGWAQGGVKAFAKGVKAYGEWDEDSITMAVAAARHAHSGINPDRLCFASTTAPFLDRQNAGVVAAALDCPPATHTFDVAGSQRAATSMLVNAPRDGKTLLVAADRRPTRPASTMEMLSGDAAAAVTLGFGAPVAEILGASALQADFVDHYRTAESSTDYSLEERWFREAGLSTMAPEAVNHALENAGVTRTEIDCLIAPLPNPALAGAVAAAVGIEKSKLADGLFHRCGHAGAAHPLLVLCDVIDRAAPGSVILLTAFGQGCDAIVLRRTEVPANRAAIDDILATQTVEDNYVKFLSASQAIDIDWGMRAERDNRTAHTVAWNKHRAIHGFVGGACSLCDTPQFPKSRRCVNPECSALDTQSDYRFADRSGVIKSFTEDWLAFTREPPLIYGNVTFDGGGNIFMEMTGFRPGELSIGAAVTPVFRIKDFDHMRGFRRYFWKAAPAVGGSHG